VAVALVLIVIVVAVLVLHKGKETNQASNTAPTNTATNGGAMVSVPDVTSPPLNLNFYAASNYLAAQGFHNVRTGPLVAPTGAAPGTVIAQDPPKNQAEPASAIASLPVTLTLDPGVTVPNWGTVEDMDRGGGIDAQGHQGAPSADDLGLKVTRIGDQPSTEDNRGDITSISPSPGSIVAKGATITVHYRN
jgi:beta-lactam-binding protein with PASTA domain